jgi:hypothetical protein
MPLFTKIIRPPKPEQAQVSSIQHQITEAEGLLDKWNTLNRAAKTARLIMDGSTVPILSTHSTEEIEELRESAQLARTQSKAAIEALEAFESQHGTEESLTARLDQLYRQKDAEERAAVKREAREVLAEMLELLAKVEDKQSRLLSIHADSFKRFGSDFSSQFPALPPGIFPHEGTLIQNSLYGGFKFLCGNYDVTLLAEDDPVAKELHRSEAWGGSLGYVTYKRRFNN